MQRGILRAAAGVGLAGAVLLGGAGAASAGPYCADGARSAVARVQLWKGAHCRGSSVIVGVADADPQRPSFAAFRSRNGRTYNVDDNRSSLAVAPGTCVRVFDGVNYTGEASNLLCAVRPHTAFGLFKFNNRVSSMRVCAVNRQADCLRNGNGSPPPPPPPASPPPPVGGFPPAWSAVPVNAPAWRPAKRTHASIRCGSRSIPANLAPQSVTRGWTPRAQAIVDIIRGPAFGWRSVGGGADGSRSGHVSNSYHYCGRAVDAFAPGVPLGTRAAGEGLNASWRLANWAAHNARSLNITEVIFYDRIWSAARGGWRPYGHPSRRNSNTLQHRDHVHLSVY